MWRVRRPRGGFGELCRVKSRWGRRGRRNVCVGCRVWGPNLRMRLWWTALESGSSVLLLGNAGSEEGFAAPGRNAEVNCEERYWEIDGVK